MTRVARLDVHAALERAAEQLRSAGGPDGIVSRREVRAKLRELKGAEQALLDVLYRFIDDRDAAPRARVTKSNIDATVALVRTELMSAAAGSRTLTARPAWPPRRARRRAGRRRRDDR